MKHHILTTRQVAAIMAKGKRGLYLDGANLYLQISRYSEDLKNGAASWLFRFERDGRLHSMGLGSAKVITLARARASLPTSVRSFFAETTRFEVRRAKKEQTREERERRHAEKRESLTFRDAAKKFISLHAPMWDDDCPP